MDYKIAEDPAHLLQEVYSDEKVWVAVQISLPTVANIDSKTVHPNGYPDGVICHPPGDSSVADEVDSPPSNGELLRIDRIRLELNMQGHGSEGYPGKVWIKPPPKVNISGWGAATITPIGGPGGTNPWGDNSPSGTIFKDVFYAQGEGKPWIGKYGHGDTEITRGGLANVEPPPLNHSGLTYGWFDGAPSTIKMETWHEDKIGVACGLRTFIAFPSPKFYGEEFVLIQYPRPAAPYDREDFAATFTVYEDTVSMADFSLPDGPIGDAEHDYSFEYKAAGFPLEFPDGPPSWFLFEATKIVEEEEEEEA